MNAIATARRYVWELSTETGKMPDQPVEILDVSKSNLDIVRIFSIKLRYVL